MKQNKKEQIEITARELFWKHGFKKVSVEEVCKKAGTSRKTFYTFYDNKTALVIYLLKELTDEMLFDYRKVIESGLSFPLKMSKLLDLKYESTKKFSMEFVADFFHPDSDEILAYYTNIVKESMELTRSFFSDAQLKGEMNSNLDLDFVMLMMQKMSEISSASDIIAFFSDSETMTRQLSQFMIYGLMPPK